MFAASSAVCDAVRGRDLFASGVSPRRPRPQWPRPTTPNDGAAWAEPGGFAAAGHRLATVRAETTSVVAAEGRYVGLDRSYASAVWSSAGRSWRKTALPRPPGQGATADSSGMLGRVIAIGRGDDPRPLWTVEHRPCQARMAIPQPGRTRISPVVWISGDGVTWKVVAPDGLDAENSTRLAGRAAGGWTAAASSWDGAALGGSSSGIGAWHRLAPDGTPARRMGWI